MIQRVLRNTFSDRTMITIAHRLQTIIDSTKILVMDKGRSVEFDTPSALFAIDDGLFHKLAEDSGLGLHEINVPSPH